MAATGLRVMLFGRMAVSPPGNQRQRCLPVILTLSRLQGTRTSDASWLRGPGGTVPLRRRQSREAARLTGGAVAVAMLIAGETRERWEGSRYTPSLLRI